MPKRTAPTTPLTGIVVVLASMVAAHAAPVTEPSLKGYGIKGVEGATLTEMLSRCIAARRGGAVLAEGETTTLLGARCAQLQRSLRTQPGNSARAAR